MKTTAFAMQPAPSTPVASAVLQRKCTGNNCGTPQRRTADDREPSLGPAIVHDVLLGPGQSLDMSTQSFMESRFGQDFSNVRIHNDQKAADSAGLINASAFTVGNNIVFGAGQFAPQTCAGQKLMAHELVHVQQQTNSPQLQGPLTISPAVGPLETEAEAAAEQVANGRSAHGVVAHRSPQTISRSVAGDIVGTSLGAAAGAGLGFLLGGPIGAVAGGLVGGALGLFAGESFSAIEFELTGTPLKEAKDVFGHSIDWDKVRVAESPIYGVLARGVTPRNTIYFQPGILSGADNEQEPKPRSDDPGPMISLSKHMPLLIHELTHVWQTQNGTAVIIEVKKAATAFVSRPLEPFYDIYDYSRA